MIGYKGFDKNLRCRGFQFEQGKEYHEDTADLCRKGFHFCENPIDVFNYYNPATSRYFKIEADNVDTKTGYNSKRCAKDIKIVSEIGITGIFDAFIEITLKKNEETKDTQSNTGNRSTATNTGYHSAATNTGDSSAATNTGYHSAATNTGDFSAATNTGCHSTATNTGCHSAATNTGDNSAATNIGYHSAAIAKGKHSVACGVGAACKASGSIGCVLFLSKGMIMKQY